MAEAALWLMVGEGGSSQASGLGIRSTMKSRLVAQGPVPDLISRSTMHTVINKDGTIVLQRERESISCK